MKPIALLLAVFASSFARAEAPLFGKFVGGYEVLASSCTNNFSNAWLNEYEEIRSIGVYSEMIVERHSVKDLVDPQGVFGSLWHQTDRKVDAGAWMRGKRDTFIDRKEDGSRLELKMTNRLKNDPKDPDEFFRYVFSRLNSGEVQLERSYQLWSARRTGAAPEILTIECRDLLK